MKKLFTILLFFFAYRSNSQDFTPIKFKQLDKLLKTESDTLYVVNFWATWCKPCVAELPYFEEINEKYQKDKVRVILVSMDFKSEIDEKLPAFLEKKQLNSDVWWFSEEKQGDFIEKIEPQWYGAIPFTLLIKGDVDFRYWKEGKWEKEELFKKVAENL